MRAVLLANRELEQRLQACRRHLLLAVPSTTYYMLLDRYTALHQSRCIGKSATTPDNAVKSDQPDGACPSQETLLQLEALHIAVCKRAAESAERERQAKAALKYPVAELSSQLAGDLQQRSVELEVSRAEATKANVKARQLSEDLRKAESLLHEAQTQLGAQAKGVLQVPYYCS